MDFIECYLAEIRSSKGMSKEKLASLVGTTVNTIDKIECGEFVPNVRLAVLIAFVLDVKVNDIWFIGKDK